MKFSGPQAFVNQLVLGLLVTIGGGGTAGLGLVWMRHQVSIVADANAGLERQLEDVDRRIKSVAALVEEEQSYDVLRARNESMHLGLVEWTPTQVVAVREDPTRGLVARANRRLYESNPELGAASVYFRLPQSAPATTAPSSAAPKAATLPGVNAAALLPTRFQLAGTP